MTSAVPYASATSTRSRDETIKLLRRLGCESIGFMDDYQKHEVLLAFTHRGRQVQLKVSAKGWAQLHLNEHPYEYSRGGYTYGYSRRRGTRQAYEEAALKQGHIAVNSILRDWMKGQVTAIECGILSFEAVFMPFMLTSDGRPLHERINELPLPQPEQQKVIPLMREQKP